MVVYSSARRGWREELDFLEEVDFFDFFLREMFILARGGGWVNEW